MVYYTSSDDDYNDPNCPQCGSRIEVKVQDVTMYYFKCTNCPWDSRSQKTALDDKSCPECGGTVFVPVDTPDCDNYPSEQIQPAYQCQDCNWGA